MIRTVAEFLRELMEREREALDGSTLKHAPTIGSMYEGLSVDLLSRAVPPGLDLQVVAGFITDGSERLSGQIDCMLVRGSGTAIPYTTGFVWHVRDVIAVFEIKKTLYSAQLTEAFAHLNEVRELEHRYIQTLRGTDDQVEIESAVRAFAETAGRMPPGYSDIATLPFHLEVLFHTLVMEHHSPLRVIIGFHGFQSEHGFRKALYDHLKENVGVSGFGVGSFPQLIVSGAYSMVKANGHPFSVPLVDEDWWPFYFSTAVNPVLMILELIWTRLNQLFDLGDMWGDDLELEVPHAFLLAKGDRLEDGSSGWHYQFVNNTPSALAGLEDVESWQPHFLTTAQWVVVNTLCQGRPVRMDDESLVAFLGGEEVSDLDEFWQSLLDTRLVARTDDGRELVLITRQCQTAVLPDGRLVAGENNTGRMSRWLRPNAQQAGQTRRNSG